MQLKFKHFCLIFSISCFFLSTGVVFAVNNWNEGYKAKENFSTPIKVTSTQSCHVVENTSPTKYFIPTKSLTEWNAFNNHLPTNVSVKNPTWSPSPSSQCNGDSFQQQNDCNTTKTVTGTKNCGTSGYSGGNYCYNNDVYRNYTNRGCSNGNCTSSTSKRKVEDCGSRGCSSGKCKTCTPVDGGWSSWSSWSSCEENSQSRSRTCTNPRRSCGGARCSGPSTETRSCDLCSSKKGQRCFYDKYTTTGPVSSTYCSMSYKKAPACKSGYESDRERKSALTPCGCSGSPWEPRTDIGAGLGCQWYQINTCTKIRYYDCDGDCTLRR